MNLRRLDMEQKTGDHVLGSLEIALRQADPEDGSADARALEPFPDPFRQRNVHTTRYLSGLTRWLLSTSSLLSLLSVTENHSNERGAGPLLTPPWSSKKLPWHGQWYPWLVRLTVQPRWVQIADRQRNVLPLRTRKTLSSSRNVTEPSGYSSGLPALKTKLGSNSTLGTRNRTAPTAEAHAAKIAAIHPSVSWKKSRRETASMFAVGFMSSVHQFNALHRDRAGRAPRRAQTASDATGLILDNSALFAAGGHTPVTREQSSLQLFVTAQIGDIHEAQAEFRTNVGAPPTEHALVAVKHRPDVAFQAAIRLPLRLGFRIIFLHFCNADTPVHGNRRWRTARKFFIIGLHAILERVVDCYARLARFSRHMPREEFRNRIRRLLALCDSGDDNPRAESHIATREYIATRSCHRFRIGQQCPARRQLQVVFGAKPGKVGRLADGEDDRVAIFCLFAALDELRIKPPVLVEYPAGLDQFDARHFTTDVKDAFRAKARVEPDAFLFRFLDLLTGRRDLVKVFQTIHVDLGDTLADGFTRDIQRKAHLVGGFDLTRGQLLDRRRGLAQSLTQFSLAHPRKHFRLPHN